MIHSSATRQRGDRSRRSTGSNTPAEIIVFNGMPQWTPIPGTQLSYPANSDSTVLKYTPTGAFYFLTSGRWFTTTHPVMGTWTFATNSLPADFAKIPSDSPAGKVLAFVPGTPEAEDAVLMAQVPTTETVNTAQAASEVKVSYAGQSQFTPIQGTSMSYATNTPNRVIEVGTEYYLCYQGVWFVFRNSQRTMASGANRAAGYLHNPAELTGLQRDVRDASARLERHGDRQLHRRLYGNLHCWSCGRRYPG